MPLSAKATATFGRLNESPELIAQELHCLVHQIFSFAASMKVLSLLLRNKLLRRFPFMFFNASMKVLSLLLRNIDISPMRKALHYLPQ